VSDVSNVSDVSEVTVRDAAPGDRAEWSRLFVDYGVFYESTFDGDVVDGVWSWLMDPSHQVKALVAELDGRIVGFTNYRRTWDTFTAGPSWFLDDLYTAPEGRGRGVATALIAGVGEKAQDPTTGRGDVRWITAADNTTAQRVYDRVATRTSWVTYELGGS
jgi:GNAT superfamily N-acetyltransferase